MAAIPLKRSAQQRLHSGELRHSDLLQPYRDSRRRRCGEVLKMLENQSAQQRPAAFGAAHGERAPVAWAKISVADFGGTGVSDCAVGNTARDTSGSRVRASGRSFPPCKIRRRYKALVRPRPVCGSHLSGFSASCRRMRLRGGRATKACGSSGLSCPRAWRALRWFGRNPLSVRPANDPSLESAKPIRRPYGRVQRLRGGGKWRVSADRPGRCL